MDEQKEKLNQRHNRNYLYLYADILGYRNLLKKRGVDAFHDHICSMFESVRASVEAEGASVSSGSIQSFAAFDTIIIFLGPIEDREIAWPLVDQICYFASLVALQTLVAYGVLLRGVLGISRDCRVAFPVITLGEIDRIFALEKAQDASTIILDLKDLLQGPFPSVPSDNDPFLWYEVPFKESPDNFDLPGPQFLATSSREHAVLNLLNQRTVRYLTENGLSFLEAVRKLEHSVNETTLAPDARTKVANSINFYRRLLDHYNTRGATPARIGTRYSRPWIPVP